MENNSRIRTDTLWTLLTQILAISSGLLMAIVSANTVGQVGFAIIAWALSYLTFVSALARLGTQQAAARIINTGNSARKDIFILLWIPTTVAILASAIWLIFLGEFIARKTIDAHVYINYVPLVGLWIPAAVLLPTIASIFRALYRFDLATLASDWIRRFVIVFVLLFVFAKNDHFKIQFSFQAAIVVEYILLICCFLVLGMKVHHQSSRNRTVISVFTVLRPFYFLSIVSLLIPQAGVWLLAFVAGPAEVANFGLALRVSFLFGVPFLVVSRVYVPRIASVASKGSVPSLEKPLLRAARSSSGIILVGIVGYLIVGPSVIKSLFGSQFSGAYVPIFLLALATLVNSSSGLCMALLANSGHAQIVSTASAIAGTLFVILSLSLGHYFGAIGVACAALTTQTCLNIVMAREAKRRLGVRTWVF